MTDIILLDYETRSEVHISNPEYTSHESTQPLCFAWGFMGSDDPQLWWVGEDLPDELIDHVKRGGLLGASDARFDREIWQLVCEKRYGFPKTTLEQWFCTQAQSRCAGVPSALDKAAMALGLKNRKLSAGKDLIKKCCVPPYSENPQDYADLGGYCLQDWVVMDEVARSIPMLTPALLEDYHQNERINNRGIKTDRELAQAATQYAEQEREEINERIKEVTCDEVEKCTQHARVKKWVMACLEEDGQDQALKLMEKHVKGEKKYSCDRATRANLLAHQETGEIQLADDVVELLNLIDDGGGSATSKFKTMVKKASRIDDRVRGAIRFAGAASTFRYTSMGLQVHNFIRDAFSPEETEHFKGQMLRGEPLSDMNGEPVRVMKTLSKLLRGAVIPEKGNVIVCGDWNAVESRMTAYLAGDDDKLQVFVDGRDPYCYAAEGIFGRPISKEKDPNERQIGKVVDLACGFLGGVGALSSMAKMFGLTIEEEKKQSIVDGWRLTHPKIVAFGDALMNAAKKAVMCPNGAVYKAGKIGYRYDHYERALYAMLPDGTDLRYHDCKFEYKPAPWDETEKITQLTALKASVTAAADATEWPRHGLWRGLLLENVVQGACAAMLREKRMDLEEACIDIIFDVHDEFVAEVHEDDAELARDVMQEIMEEAPAWAEGLPLTAEPAIMKRWGK